MLVILSEDNLQKYRLKCICLTDLVIYAILEPLAKKRKYIELLLYTRPPLNSQEKHVKYANLKGVFCISAVPNEIFPLNYTRFIHPSNLQISFKRM